VGVPQVVAEERVQRLADFKAVGEKVGEWLLSKVLEGKSVSLNKLIEKVIRTAGLDKICRALGLAPGDEIYIVLEPRGLPAGSEPGLESYPLPKGRTRLIAGRYVVYIETEDTTYSMLLVRKRDGELEPLPVGKKLAELICGIADAAAEALRYAESRLWLRLSDKSLSKEEKEKIVNALNKIWKLDEKLERELGTIYPDFYYVMVHGPARDAVSALLFFVLSTKSLSEIFQKATLDAVLVPPPDISPVRLYLGGVKHAVGVTEALPLLVALHRKGLISGDVLARIYLLSKDMQLLDYIDTGGFRHEVEPLLRKVIEELDIDYEGARAFNRWVKTHLAEEEEKRAEPVSEEELRSYLESALQTVATKLGEVIARNPEAYTYMADLSRAVRDMIYSTLDLDFLCRAAGLKPDAKVLMVLRNAHTNWHGVFHRELPEVYRIYDEAEDEYVFRKYVIEYQGNDESDIAHTKWYGGYIMFARYDTKSEKFDLVPIPGVVGKVLKHFLMKLPDIFARALVEAWRRVRGDAEREKRFRVFVREFVRNLMWPIEDDRKAAEYSEKILKYVEEGNIEKIRSAVMELVGSPYEKWVADFIGLGEFLYDNLWHIGHDCATVMMLPMTAREAVKLALAFGLCHDDFSSILSSHEATQVRFEYTSNVQLVKGSGAECIAEVMSNGATLYSSSGGRALMFGKYLAREGLVEDRDLYLATAALLYTDAEFKKNEILPFAAPAILEEIEQIAEEVFRVSPVLYKRLLERILGVAPKTEEKAKHKVKVAV